MDGNGRWAKARGVPRLMGHRAGRESVREAVKGCVELRRRVLTLYTFSIENWNRPAREIAALMTILRQTPAGGAARLKVQQRAAPGGGPRRRPARSGARRDRGDSAFLSGSTGLSLNLALSTAARRAV